MTTLPDNDSRTRILDIAEELFANRGYTAVRLRDIAAAVGMRHASLYYYAPGGKEELFIEVTRRNIHRHHAGLTAAIAAADPTFHAQIHAVAHWFATQPPLDLMRMSHADLLEIDPPQAEALMQEAFDLRLPLEAILTRAAADHEIVVTDTSTAALSFITMLQGVHMIPPQYAAPALRQAIAHDMANMMLYGWVKRERQDVERSS